MKKHGLRLPGPLSYVRIQNFSKSGLLFYIKCLHKILAHERSILFSFRKKNRKLEGKLKLLKQKETHPVEEEVEDPLKFVQEIKSVAEEAQRVAGFVYEPVSGLYYDSKTGYYYNAELRLYYDGNTGIYYSYDAGTNQFLYHSQVYSEGKEKPVSLIAEVSGEKKETQNSRKWQKKRRKSVEKAEKRAKEAEMEDGEVLSSDESEEEEVKQEKLSGDAIRYAPSLRMIVQQSAVEHLAPGTLFVLTCKGGTLGREGTHDILIRDVNVSKYHLKFVYDETKSSYQIIDLGSTNGTILNGQRMTTSKRESEAVDLTHDSIIELSGTRLLCHVHGGTETCDDCHPGLIKSTQKIHTSTDDPAKGQSLEKSRLQIQKRLQKKYGLATEKYQEAKTFADEAYVDRAATRRETVGSSHDSEKTEVASTEWAISRKNKGFKLLSQMGWTEGQSLGNTEEALKEPIQVVGHQGTTGLGYGS
uniref:Putative rna-binding protein rbm5 n=1 Tax=Lutzomyia longipalpis TaxID=7200 RepID=A0A1B0CLG1_LUTLO